MRCAGDNQRLRTFAIASLLSVAAACGGAKPCRLDEIAPVSKRSSADAQALIQDILTHRSALRAFKAEAKFTRRDGSDRVRGRVFMFAERGGKLRIDVMTQFGPVATLASDGATFAWVDHQHKRYAHGVACASTLAGFTGLALSAAEFVGLVFGEPPLLPGEPGFAGGCRDDGAFPIAREAVSGASEVSWLAPVAGGSQGNSAAQRFAFVESARRAPGGRLLWRAVFADFATIKLPAATGPSSTVVHPKRIEFDEPTRKASTRIDIVDVKPLPAVPPEALVVDAPAGYTDDVLECDLPRDPALR